MGLHFWLLPFLAILGTAIFVFYLAMKHAGGPGVRTHGRVVIDKDEDIPPWT